MKEGEREEEEAALAGLHAEQAASVCTVHQVRRKTLHHMVYKRGGVVN